MNARILSAAAVGGPPAIVSAPSHVLDDATRELVRSEAAAAHARGVAEGRAAAVAEARAEAAAVAAATEAASQLLRATLVSQHGALADALARRVLDTTRAVLGREPDDDGRALVERVHAALARVDEPSIELRVPAAREAVVREAVAGRDDVTIEVDDTLGADDAVLRGEFARADLRVSRLLAALEDVLVDLPVLGPLPGPVDTEEPS